MDTGHYRCKIHTNYKDKITRKIGIRQNNTAEKMQFVDIFSFFCVQPK